MIVVSLATHDRDRVGKLANYIQPQLVGGLRHTMEEGDQFAHPGHSRRRQGGSRGERGCQRRGHRHLRNSESPKGSGLGHLLDGALKKAQFTPAYENGTPAPAGINVVANFSQF